jgi:hypothetical protein
MKEETKRFKDYMETKGISFPYSAYAIESDHRLIVGINCKGKEIEVIAPWSV